MTQRRTPWLTQPRPLYFVQTLALLAAWLSTAPAHAQAPAAASAKAPDWQAIALLNAAQSADSASNVRIVALAPLASGDLYVVGNFSGTVRLGKTKLTSAGGTDVLVARWNPVTYAFRWVVRAGGTADDEATAVAAGDGGGPYVAGSFGAAATFGEIALAGGGKSTAFVAGLSNAGVFGWAQALGTPGPSEATAIAVHGPDIYVAGTFSEAAQFGIATLKSAGGDDVFVTKFTAAPAAPPDAPAAPAAPRYRWTARAGGPADDDAHALTLKDRTLYVGGCFESKTASFGPKTIANTSQQSDSGEYYSDAFVAKLLDNGTTATWVWALAAGGKNEERVKALAVRGTEVYATGEFGAAGSTFGETKLVGQGESDVFVARLTDIGGTGVWNWALPAGGPGPDQAAALVLQEKDVLVGGTFGGGPVRFGAARLPASAGGAAGRDGFLAQLTDAGTAAAWAWAKPVGGPRPDNASALALVGGKLYVAGEVQAPATFDSFGLQGKPMTGAFLGLLSLPPGFLMAKAYVWRPTAKPVTLTLLTPKGQVARTETLPPAEVGDQYSFKREKLMPGVYNLRMESEAGTNWQRVVVP